MQFELQDDNHEIGTVTFEGNERAIANIAILNALLKAATVGGSQIETNDTLQSLAIFLRPEYATSVHTSVRAPHLDTLAAIVASSNENIAYDQASEVGGFIMQLRVAANVLRSNSTLETQSEEAIDRIIEQIDIPDSPEGLDS